MKSRNNSHYSYFFFKTPLFNYILNQIDSAQLNVTDIGNI